MFVKNFLRWAGGGGFAPFVLRFPVVLIAYPSHFVHDWQCQSPVSSKTPSPEVQRSTAICLTIWDWFEPSARRARGRPTRPRCGRDGLGHAARTEGITRTRKTPNSRDTFYSSSAESAADEDAGLTPLAKPNSSETAPRHLAFSSGLICGWAANP